MTSSKVLSGLDTAATVYETFNDRIKVLSTKGVVPGLCVVLVGEHPASQIYVKTKSKKDRKKLLSSIEKNWIIPTARTKPGMAYPKDKTKLIVFRKAPLSNLFKKLNKKANEVHIIPARIPRKMVLKKLERKLFEKNLSEV